MTRNKPGVVLCWMAPGFPGAGCCPIRYFTVCYLRFWGDDDFLIIECENYFSGKLVFDDGLPLTTKSDSQNHGFGTHSIRTLSEKYDGTFKLSVQDDIFTLSILIPIPA